MPETSRDRSAIRVGAVFRPQFAPEGLASAARAADDAGLDELWLWEDCFLAGGISAAAIALSHSTNLVIGVGVLPVPMRNVALTAMEIATLARAFPGRVRIGVGHGVQEWMAQIGEKVGSPMTLLREYLSATTALLRGERVTVDGRYVHLDGVALDWPPDPGVELLSAAGGPKTLRLSGELASGTVISGGTTPDELRRAVVEVRAGETVGNRTEPSSIVTYVLCTTGSDSRAALDEEIRHWELDPANADDLGVHGTAAQIARGARRWVDAGADTIILQPTADADIEDFVTFIARDVQPLLKDATRYE